MSPMFIDISRMYLPASNCLHFNCHNLMNGNYDLQVVWLFRIFVMLNCFGCLYILYC